MEYPVSLRDEIRSWKPEGLLLFAGHTSNHFFGFLKWCRVSSIHSSPGTRSGHLKDPERGPTLYRPLRNSTRKIDDRQFESRRLSGSLRKNEKRRRRGLCHSTKVGVYIVHYLSNHHCLFGVGRVDIWEKHLLEKVDSLGVWT